MSGPNIQSWNLTVDLVEESDEMSQTLSCYTSDYNRAVNQSKLLFEWLKQQLEEAPESHQELDGKIRDKCLCADQRTADLVRRYDNLKQKLKLKEQIGLRLLSQLGHKLKLERHLILQLAEQEKILREISLNAIQEAI